MILEDVAAFIKGLKKAKNVYAECPLCKSIFSLHSARLIYGKTPPKDFLSKAQRQVELAQEELTNIQEQYEGEKEELQSELELKDERWVGKMDLLETESKGKILQLNEKLRHLKNDIAAAQKEVIREKVDMALLRQRGVIEGHIAELFPLFRKTRINPADICGLVPTAPVDFVVFDGLFQKEVDNIVFLDVKKGGGQLNPVQRTIRDSIRGGNVEFKKLRVNFDEIKGTAIEED